MSAIITQLRTTHLDESIEFFTGKLGFELEFRYQDFYAGIKYGDQVFHLKLVDDPEPNIDFVAQGEHFHLYFTLVDVSGMAAALKNQAVDFVNDVHKTPWGTEEFSIKDNQGHTIYFGNSS
jgi:catechol 2,3-dioxygenase-like lactoylglutathione lyase family enzyme